MTSLQRITTSTNKKKSSKMETSYEEQANEFAKKYNVKLKLIAEPVFGKHFHDDKRDRWRFKMRLSRGKKYYQFWFGQAIAAGKEEPTMHDVLSAITMYHPGTFAEFCDEVEMEPTKHAAKIYRDVLIEYKKVCSMFGEVMEELKEIY